MGNDPARKENLEKVLEAVYLYFKGDQDQVKIWLNQPHSQLGGETPINLIRSDRFDLLVEVIRTMVDELE